MNHVPESTPRILVAEDDPAAANVLHTLLTRVGYEVEVARDGRAALRMLESGPAPDLLLLDWMLPGVSGLEICLRVRERWDAATLPILMVTAKTDAESIAEAFEAGANDYLSKPFMTGELRSRIASHLRLKRLVEERRQMDESLMERDKLYALGLLVSSVAHDLNNPLAAIMGNAQLLAEEEVDPDRLTLVRSILGDVKRCNRIVADLLAFARHRPTDASVVDVGELVRETLRMRERHLRGMGVDLRLDLDPALPRVRGVAHQLQQVILNILINAEQALRPSGGRLEIHARADGRDSGEAEGSEVEIAVANDGPPIPPEVLPRIFDPFYTTKPPDEGTGLGLAICQRIVREHRGEIEVDTGDAGTVFRVRLPAANATSD